MSTVTLFGCGGGQDDTTGGPSGMPSTRARSTAQVGRPRPIEQRADRRHKGHGKVDMFRQNCELPGGSEYFWPERNGWDAEAMGSQTIVCAGGAGSDKPGAGRLLIIRDGRLFPKRRTGIFQRTIPGVGPLKITDAPQGPHAAIRGQLDGAIRFRAANGVTGILHLSDDAVTLNE